MNVMKGLCSVCLSSNVDVVIKLGKVLCKKCLENNVKN